MPAAARKLPPPTPGSMFERSFLEARIKRQEKVVTAATRLIYSHIGNREEKLKELRRAVREYEQDEKGIWV